MPQGCSQVAWCPGVHPESLNGCFRRWKITQCFCCLWELIKRLKLKLWGLGVRPASEERLWDLVLTGWRAAEPETCRDVHWSSFRRIGEHLTWRRVCGKSRKKHPEFYFSHRGQWKRNPSGYQKWRCLFCFVRQGKHITFTVFFTLACNLWKSKAERPQPFFFLPLPSHPLGLLSARTLKSFLSWAKLASAQTGSRAAEVVKWGLMSFGWRPEGMCKARRLKAGSI